MIIFWPSIKESSVLESQSGLLATAANLSYSNFCTPLKTSQNFKPPGPWLSDEIDIVASILQFPNFPLHQVITLKGNPIEYQAIPLYSAR
ncbi:hypothetical protein TNIN_151011 [Trichonephila inaurata madagascariensis]|uniref:Uncharacterized protein n=1 Tax=Trichonephila inaurata madagascariensis TaxID=2747483 RepID=A0A8X6Y063_9ARAC|nr:hypothetical protein TNIN_151011 [Trichonephila inaurata madagascariensis]